MSFNDIGKFLGENAACEIITTINRKKSPKIVYILPPTPAPTTHPNKKMREIH